MNAKEYTAHIDQVFRENSPEDICMFLSVRALKSPYLGYILLHQFNSPAKVEDARSRVQQCFLAPANEREYFRSRLDWRQVDLNLGRIMQEALELERQGDAVGAVEIARQVIVLTYQEYRDDHPSLKSDDINLNFHTTEALDLLRRVLLDNAYGLPADERRSQALAFTRDVISIQSKDRFCPITQFLNDAKAITMTAKGYAAVLIRKIEALPAPDNHPYVGQLAEHYFGRAAARKRKRREGDFEQGMDLVRRFPGCHQAHQALVGYLRTEVAAMPVNTHYEFIFRPSHIDDGCRAIAIRLSADARKVRETLAKGQTLQAVTSYLQMLRAMTAHFIADGHFRHSTDHYAPDAVLRELHAAIADAPLPIEDRALVEAGHEVICESECHQRYGYPSYLTQQSPHAT